jgi:ribosomal protein S18 acetylase RimI-like enzyme
VDLWKAVFGYETAHNNPHLAIDKKLQVADDLLFVAIADKTVVGTIMAGYDGHRGWLYSLGVTPSHRRQGIGSQLVVHAERALILKGCVKINLQILEGNEKVTTFYETLGFSVEKRINMGKRIPQNVPSL